MLICLGCALTGHVVQWQSWVGTVETEWLHSLKYLLPGPLPKTFSDFWYTLYATKECSLYSSGTPRHWGVEKYLALTSEDLGTNSGQVTLNKFMDPPFVLVYSST